MSTSAHVICVDDHKIVASGCQAEFTRAGLPWTVSWYPHLADVVWPEGERVVALLDLRLADRTDPAKNIADLESRGIPVVVYTSGEKRYLLRQAIEAGALAIVNKKEETSVLIEAVERALEGRATGSFDWATALDEDEDFTKRLTASKLEVLRLYAGGLSAKQVAHRLDLALNTVNKYVSEIKDEYRKAGRLSQGDRVALFREAVHDGILPD